MAEHELDARKYAEQLPQGLQKFETGKTILNITTLPEGDLSLYL